ncbi:MAG: adenine deaminase [Ignavibacteria bacterium]|jgi:adenine deaminase
MSNQFIISGNIVDIINRRIFKGTVEVDDGKIKNIKEDSNSSQDNYILPGFIDSHVHIESSMLVPSEFARLAVVHGTVAVVSDPHEIANVLGIKGIRYMIDNGKKVPFKFYFGASSCVPATSFETSGAEITASDIRELFTKDKLLFLSEMMNYPGVLSKDPSVMEKINIAKQFGRPIDGHAPGLRGEDAKNYISSGITTDHECFTLDEALDKINFGMKILIREGSAAKNYGALYTLIKSHPETVMFCSDDKHPNDLVVSHIDEMVKRSVAGGYDLIDVLRCASLNPVIHYKLDVGLLRVDDPADFIVVNNLNEFKVIQTYIRGQLVAEDNITKIEHVNAEVLNNFDILLKTPEDFIIKEELFITNDGVPVVPGVRVIEALDGQLVTNELHINPKSSYGKLESDPENDILKIAVVDRYHDAKPAVGFIKNFELKKGAIASSVAHDSHNIIAVGVTDREICSAVNVVIKSKGGISVAYDGNTEVLSLPVAGIMTNDDGYLTAKKYSQLDKLAKDLGSKLNAPYMTLSFMALLVIPQLKLSDKGLFDGKAFKFVDLTV